MNLDDLLGMDPEDPAQIAAEQDTDDFCRLIADLVKQRKACNMTQADVAEIMRTTQSAVSNIESIAGDPRISTLQRYARAVRSRLHVCAISTGAAAHTAQFTSTGQRRPHMATSSPWQDPMKSFTTSDRQPGRAEVHL